MNQLLSLIRRVVQDDSYYQQNFANDGERLLAWYLRYFPFPPASLMLYDR